MTIAEKRDLIAGGVKVLRESGVTWEILVQVNVNGGIVGLDADEILAGKHDDLLASIGG